MEIGSPANARKEAAGIVKRSSAFSADPRTITRRPGWNPRFDFGEIEELAKSIKEHGLLMPLRVKRVKPHVKDDGKGPYGTQEFHFELIDGDRRLTALELLLQQGIDFPDGVQVIIVDKAQDDLTSLFQMYEANTGKPFLPLEEAAAFKRMRDAGMTIAEICAKVGRKQVHVTSMLALLDTDEEVQEALKAGHIGTTVAKEIAVHARGDKVTQKKLVKQAKAAGKDKKARRAVKREIEKVRVEKAQKQGRVVKMRALTDAQLSDLGSAAASHLETLLAKAGLPADVAETDLEFIRSDALMAVAFAYGQLQGLKAAAGLEVDFEV